MEKHELICNEQNCTGCRACLMSCNKNAIDFIEGNDGRRVAAINKNKCIDCGLCKKVCPANQDTQFNYPLICYAARSKDEKIKEHCSSGGAASTFGLCALNLGGAYFGASSYPVEIKKCTSFDEIIDTCGSKYVESSTSGSYLEVRDCLKLGQTVVYLGMPCQISGLKSFLRKDYDNLITVDIICHGMPPSEYLKESLGKNVKDCDEVSFRTNKQWILKAFKNKKMIFEEDSFINSYFTLFLKGITFRENCYSCKYARAERVSDITIGDFWGLNNDEIKNEYDGNISAVLINTQKGKDFFELTSDKFIYEERPVEEAIKGNSQLNAPIEKGNDRLQFEKLCSTRGYKYALSHNDIAKTIKVRKLKNTIKSIIKI